MARKPPSGARLRGTHLIAIQSIESADINYRLTLQRLETYERLLYRLIAHIKKLKRGTLTNRTITKIKKELAEYPLNFIFPTFPGVGTYIKFLSARLVEVHVARNKAQHSVVVNLTNTFDEFVYRLAFKFYQHEPERMKSDLTIDFKTLHQIFEAQKVEHQLIKVVVYKKLLSARLDVKFKLLSDIVGRPLVAKEDLKELFYVRNAVVHNGGFVGDQLVRNFPKFVGLERVHLGEDDYLRYKKAVLSTIQDLRMYFNSGNNEQTFGARFYIDVIKGNKNLEKGLLREKMYFESGLFYLGTDLEILKRLAEKKPKAFFKTVSTLCKSDIFECRYLATQFLLKRFKEGSDDDKVAVGIFIMQNLSHFRSWFIFDRLTKILVWYITNKEAYSLFVLCKSGFYPHRRMAFTVFDQGELIINPQFGYKAFSALPLHAIHPRVQAAAKKLVKRMKNRHKGAYRRVEKVVKHLEN